MHKLLKILDNATEEWDNIKRIHQAIMKKVC